LSAPPGKDQKVDSTDQYEQSKENAGIDAFGAVVLHVAKIALKISPCA
jgi:hypothetical protein